MKHENAEEAFRAFLTGQGLSLDTSLTLSEGITAAITFYREQRFAGCDLESNGDMLLLQWGAYSWTDNQFSVNMTRQFISGDGEDDDIFQLHFKFLYAPFDDMPSANSGWCETPDALSAFEVLIAASPVAAQFAVAKPLSVTLSYNCAG